MQSPKDVPDQAKMGLIVLSFAATVDDNIKNGYLLNSNNAVRVAVKLAQDPPITRSVDGLNKLLPQSIVRLLAKFNVNKQQAQPVKIRCNLKW